MVHYPELNAPSIHSDFREWYDHLRTISNPGDRE
jgi:hypothetical protein